MGLHRIMLRILMFVGMLWSGHTLYAQSVVNYLNFHGTAESDDRSFLIDNIKKITFTEDAMELVMENRNENVAFNDFSLITFGETAISSGVEETLRDDGFIVKYNKSIQELEVSSSAPIVSLQVYSLQGKLIVAMSPQALSAIVSLADYPSGIYVMRASTGESVITQKIVKL